MNRGVLFNTKPCNDIFGDRLYFFESAFHLYMLLQTIKRDVNVVFAISQIITSVGMSGLGSRLRTY